jgi:hypothetical protein
LPDTAELLTTADELASSGRVTEAIDLLTAENRRERRADLECRIVELRHDAWRQLEPRQPQEWDRPIADHFPGETGIPELPAAELTGELIHSAMLHHGGLVVRGLVPAETCEALCDGIDRSWEAIDRYRETREFDPAWYHPLDLSRYGLTIEARTWIHGSGTAYVPDSPRLLFDLFEALDASGIKGVVADYFGEDPAMSWVKLAQRKLAPDATGGWHQDGAVYGMTARTLNLWLPVTRCGDVAPGLEMWPRRLDSMVDTMSDTGFESFSATHDAVTTLTDEVPVSRPVFEPGDGALFDQFLLHQTAASADYTRQRYGFECWFFAPSTYPDPDRWIPLTY